MENFFTTASAYVSLYNNHNTVNSEKNFFELITSFVEPGNVVPNFWYKTIVDQKGRPDLGAITLLSEILALYRLIPKDKFSIDAFIDVDQQPILIGNSIRISNDYFANKFGFSKDMVRRGLIFLEKLNIVERDVVNIALKTGSRSNRILITINRDFLESCFRDQKTDIRAQKNEFQSSENSIDHISNKNFIKDRSIGSNFIKNSLESSKELVQKPEIPKTKSTKHINFFLKPKTLAEFYPLSAEDGNTLQSMTGRHFSLNAMNEILKSLSNKLSNHLFNSKKGFMSYMEKVFKNEMRDETKVSNHTFRIRANLTEEDKIEKYLTEIENTPIVSPEWHLKKKLACVLRPKTAYELLRSYKTINITKTEAKVELQDYIKLTDLEKNIILSQIKATHETIENSGNFLPIEKLALIMPSINKTENKDNKLKMIPRTGIWGNIRAKISEYLGRDGDAIDTHWFGRLEAEIDEQAKQIKLKAPNNFMKATIEDRYKDTIYDAARNCGFTLEEIYC